MSTRTPLARRIIAALLLVILTACHTWRPVTIGPQMPPSPIRFTTASGEVLILRAVTVTNDSIVGVTDDGVARLAWPDVRSVEVLASDTRRTIALGLLAGLVFLGVGTVAALMSLEDS